MTETPVIHDFPSRILSLPQEVLVDILLHLSPQHISAFSQTCWQARQLVEHSSYLWRTVFRNTWDTVGGSHHDLPALSPTPPRPQQAECSSIATRAQARNKGKGKAKATFDREEGSTAHLDGHVSLQSLVKRRTRAANSLIKGAADQHYLLHNHEWALRELIATARSRRSRQQCHADPNADSPSSRTAARLAAFFPPNRQGDARWAAYIYPRQDLDRLMDWQFEVRSPSEPETGSYRAAHDATESPGAPTTNKRRKRSASVGATAKPIPRNLRCFQRSGDSLVRPLKDCRVREDLAAELHVLHGIRRMQRDTPMDKLQKARTRLKQMRADKDVQQMSTPKSRVGDDDDGDDGETPGNRSSSMLSEEDLSTLRDRDSNETPLDMDIDGITDLTMPTFLAGRQLEPNELLLGSEDGPQGDLKLQARAKSIVYDSGRFSYENAWGPLKPFRDSRDRVEGPSMAWVDDSDDDSQDGDFHVNGALSGDDDDDDSSDDGSGDHHDDPIVIDETVEGAAAEQHGVEANGTDWPSSDGEEIRGLGGNDGDGHLIAVDADDDSSDTSSQDVSDDSSFEDMFIHREDHFARRVAWVGAYAGSKVRGDLLEMQKAPGHARTKAADSGKAWSTQRQVDWVVLESIMITTHCALVRGIADGWGQGFSLPPGARGDPAQGDASLMSDSVRNLQSLLPPKSWNHSRGTVMSDATSNPSSHTRDWANVEHATWAGTYFFCDYPVFLKYNAQLAQSVDEGRGRRDGNSLSLHREAIGDCLALRLELLTPEEGAEAKAKQEERGDTTDLMGEDDPEFPTIRFKGRTFTYTREGPDPLPRGSTHGFVRPIHATPAEQAHRPYLSRYHAPTDQHLPEITALHWKIVHAYEGEDRWSLTGIQVGPPGTRAPIYGMWSDVEDGRGAPVGPFVYSNVDSRPWKEVLELMAKYRVEAERRSRAQAAQGRAD